MNDWQALYLEVAELATRAVEDDLDPAGCERLASLLRTSSEAREMYREVMACISTLTWDCCPQDESILSSTVLGQAIAKRESEPDNRDDYQCEDILASLAELEASVKTVPVDITDELAKRQLEKQESQRIELEIADEDQAYRVVVIPRFVAYAAVAACLSIGFWLAWVAWPDNSSTTTGPVAESPEDQLAPPVQVILGSLVRTHHASWAGATSPQAGTDLQPGIMNLMGGYAEIKMQSGAIVLAQAPARFELINDNTIKLIEGNVVADVPPAAKYFTVITPTATVVDFGTNFGVTTSQQKGTVTAVFDGEIEVRGNTDFEGDRASLRLTAGQAGEVDSAGQLNSEFRSLMSEDLLTFVPSWEVAERGWRASGQIQEAVAERLSLTPGHTENDNHMLLIPERKSVALSRYLSVLVPGGDLTGQVPRRRLAAGTLVDSYTVHLDAVGERNTLDSLFLAADVRFDRPILGVIYETTQYLNTVDLLGNPDVSYPETDHLMGIEPEEDHIAISDDGNTLRLRLGVSNGVDQIRVLIDAEPPADQEAE